MTQADTVEGEARHNPLGPRSLEQLFLAARTRKCWSSRPVQPALLGRLYELAVMGPTAMNASPARFVFVTSEAAKSRLAQLVLGTNREAVLSAPVCAIVGYDLAFPRHLERLFPHFAGAAAVFDDRALAEETAFRNGTLQGAYLMLAARALGLDVGPMSGFDAPAVTAEFFGGTDVRANFLCNLGYGTDESLFPRLPRLLFAEAASIL